VGIPDPAISDRCLYRVGAAKSAEISVPESRAVKGIYRLRRREGFRDDGMGKDARGNRIKRSYRPKKNPNSTDRSGGPPVILEGGRT